MTKYNSMGTFLANYVSSVIYSLKGRRKHIVQPTGTQWRLIKAILHYSIINHINCLLS